MEFLTLNQLWALLTLIVLELVLGVDNLVILSLLCGKLPQAQQARARQMGLLLALVLRLGLLGSAWWITQLTHPWFMIADHAVSGRDVLFLSGGVFLLYKGISELRVMMGRSEQIVRLTTSADLAWVIVQIAFYDMVFSLDSVMTAVAMTPHFMIMASAIVLAILAMLYASGFLCALIERCPHLKILALSFVVLIGVVLILDGLEHTVARTTLYAIMGFSVAVEFIHHRYRAQTKVDR